MKVRLQEPQLQIQLSIKQPRPRPPNDKNNEQTLLFVCVLLQSCRKWIDACWKKQGRSHMISVRVCQPAQDFKEFGML
jgi:hypothetical protein